MAEKLEVHVPSEFLNAHFYCPSDVGWKVSALDADYHHVSLLQERTFTC